MEGDSQGLASHLDDLVLAVRSATSERAGLSLTAAATLARLDREGPARLTELADAEGVSQPSMTSLIARLCGQGLVLREPDPSDGRAVVLSVTDVGRDLLAQRRAARTARLTPFLADLSADDVRRITDALPALLTLTDALRRSSTSTSTSTSTSREASR